MEAVSEFADLRLGKGVVRAQDTPGFIANRIGAFATCHILHLAQEEGLSVEEVDRLCGPLLGWPKSAVFGTLDLVGLDILANMARHLRENLPDEESREVFTLPDFIAKMVERGWLGAKTQAGFYKPGHSPSGETQVLDLPTLEYRTPRKVHFVELEAVRAIEDTGQRVCQLVQSEDRVGRFLWKALSRTFLYTARCLPEIADRIVDVNHAMRWGFGWELGPFDLWDAVGLEKSVRRLEQEGRPIPENITRMLKAGRRRFYEPFDGGRKYFDFRWGHYRTVEQPQGILLLQGARDSPPVIRHNADASLRDLGDGILCLEFHSKMNSIGAGAIEMLNAGLQELSKSFDALLIANQGTNFSAGANLRLLLQEIESNHWTGLEETIRSFQQANMAIKYASKPVVAAPFKLTLGGGCELVLAAPRVRAAAETYMGLVEAGAGLVPTGGGCKELLLRAVDPLPARAEMLDAVREVFGMIRYARVSSSAVETFRMQFLRPSDSITLNPDRLLGEAKRTALQMVRDGYHPPRRTPREDVRVVGEDGLAELKVSIHIARQGGFITDHDARVATRIAHILCGGKISGPTTVSEQYLLELEREAFLSLCGEPLTQARMKHMLETGKPLRN